MSNRPLGFIVALFIVLCGLGLWMLDLSEQPRDSPEESGSEEAETQSPGQTLLLLASDPVAASPSPKGDRANVQSPAQATTQIGFAGAMSAPSGGAFGNERQHAAREPPVQRGHD